VLKLHDLQLPKNNPRKLEFKCISAREAFELEISAEVLENLHNLQLPKNDPRKLEISAKEAS
jgi:hypothetical protein